MNWKQLVETSQANTFVLPEGWDSRAKIAEQLGCSDEQAGRIMAPLVKNHSVKSQVFPVWDKLVKRVVRVTAYQPVKK